jgi:hypothetical protein
MQVPDQAHFKASLIRIIHVKSTIRGWYGVIPRCAHFAVLSHVTPIGSEATTRSFTQRRQQGGLVNVEDATVAPSASSAAEVVVFERTEHVHVLAGFPPQRTALQYYASFAALKCEFSIK